MKIFDRIIKSALFRDSCSTTFLRVVARSIGLLIPFFIAGWFGISSQTDAFFFVYGIVIFVTSVYSNTLETFIVPYVGEVRSEKEGNVNLFITQVLSTSFIVSLFVTIFILIGSQRLIPHIIQFSESNLNLVFRLLVEISPLFMLVTFSSILSGILNSYNHFKIPAVSPAFRAIMTLGIIFIFRAQLGIHSIILGYVLGEAFRCIVLLMVCVQRNFISFNFNLKFSKSIAAFYKTVFQRITGMLAVSFNPIIDKTMASWLGLGAISVLDYADKIYAIPVVVLVEGFMVVILSYWTRIQYEGKGFCELKREVMKTCKIIALFSALFSLILFLFRYSIINVIFGGKLIQPNELIMMADALGYYLFGFAPLMLVMVLVRAFTVLKQGMFLMITGFMNCFLNIVLNLLLMQKLGLLGIALSTSIVQVIVLIIYWIYFQKFKETAVA